MPSPCPIRRAALEARSCMDQLSAMLLSHRANDENVVIRTLLSSVLEYSQELSVSISLYPLMRVAITSAQPYLFSTPKLIEATGEFA